MLKNTSSTWGKAASIIFMCFFIMLLGCDDHEASTVITIKPYYHDTELGCEARFNYQQEKWQLAQILFYLSDVEFQSSSDEWQSWPMTVSSSQTERVALIGKNCDDISSTGNWQLQLSDIPQASAIKKIRFTLGVPFILNHANPLTQPSPLNDSSMFWVWQTGHKFMRLETQSEDDNWLFHLGSTGCGSASVMRAPKSECLYPNKVKVELEFNLNKPAIVFDIAQLLKDTAMSSETSCKSAVNDKRCQTLFNNLGINSNQKVFRRQ
ncbi:MbnP family copper-binding protein [Colwelliaceae bacterium 6471]